MTKPERRPERERRPEPGREDLRHAVRRPLAGHVRQVHESQRVYSVEVVEIVLRDGGGVQRRRGRIRRGVGGRADAGVRSRVGGRRGKRDEVGEHVALSGLRLVAAQRSDEQVAGDVRAVRIGRDHPRDGGPLHVRQERRLDRRHDRSRRAGRPGVLEQRVELLHPRRQEGALQLGVVGVDHGLIRRAARELEEEHRRLDLPLDAPGCRELLLVEAEDPVAVERDGAVRRSPAPRRDGLRLERGAVRRVRRLQDERAVRERRRRRPRRRGAGRPVHARRRVGRGRAQRRWWSPSRSSCPRARGRSRPGSACASATRGPTWPRRGRPERRCPTRGCCTSRPPSPRRPRGSRRTLAGAR